MIKTKTFAFIALLLGGTANYGQNHDGGNPIIVNVDLSLTKLQDSVYIYTHFFPWASNGMFILLPENEGILINTPCESSGTEALLDWIEKNFGHLKITAVVTGFHQDNLGGGEVLLSRKIPVYGSDLTVRLVKEKGAELKEVILNSVSSPEFKKYYDSYKKMDLVPPDKIFPINDGLKLKRGDEVFEVFFPGESHTIDNTVVYLHKRKILFGGCMIKGMEFNNPGYIKYANMKEWPRSVKRVMDRFKESRIVVPGHGKEGGMELLPHMILLLDQWNKENAKSN